MRINRRSVIASLLVAAIFICTGATGFACDKNFNSSPPVDMSDGTRSTSLYDVKAVFEDGSKSEGYKINLCRARTIHIYRDEVTFTT